MPSVFDIVAENNPVLLTRVEEADRAGDALRAGKAAFQRALYSLQPGLISLEAGGEHAGGGGRQAVLQHHTNMRLN